MLSKTLKAFSFCVPCIVSISSGNAQSSGAVFVGSLGGVEVQVQGDKALFESNGLLRETNPLSQAMKERGVQKIGVEKDKIEIYKYKTNEPKIIHFLLPFEPTPTATGIQIIDQTKGLQLLNSSVIELASTVLSQTVVLATPTLTSPTEYNTKTINPPEIGLYKETEKTFHATTSVPMSPPSSSFAPDGSYIDLDFETSDTIRVYPKGKDGSSVSGFFEQIIRKAPDSHGGKTDNGEHQKKQTVSSSTQSSATHSDGSITGSSIVSSATVASLSTPMLEQEVSAPTEELAGTSKEPSEFKFVKYHSIENSSHEKARNAILERLKEMKDNGSPVVQWVAQEKIDGSNYSFWTDGKKVRVAKRTGWIVEGDHFFDDSAIYEKYHQNILDMFKKYCEEGDTLTVTGELYGGNIQKRIFYQQGFDFAAFDIFFNNRKIDYNKFIEWTSATEIPIAKEVRIFDSFEEALAFNPVFQSLHGPIEKDQNAEGVVIKPVQPLFLKNRKHIILKIINPDFCETGNRKEKPVKNMDTAISEDNQHVLDALIAEITEARLLSVRSKVGPITEKNIKKINGMFIRDAIDEYNKKNEKPPKEQVNNDRQWKLILTKLGKKAQELIKDHPDLEEQ
ncbi:RNA ligase family protein [Endozoicomonas euniceicola]|uniref:RNA ligase domain-containing protein n=1 Tax=Endozoicomonas euniceicola TaxID=1234143 RepID=A0ABY6GNX5_9GAMM|nr:RNA ligase family protein [Endozoicomonas euniceicola]UYM14109.1 hypothetical protein NX720_14455 [Endozoicomonas euniceicola]